MGHGDIALARQCELLGVSRSGYYYRPVGESELNLELMRLLDEHYTATPFYGIRRMTAWLRRQGYRVNPKRVGRLMRAMGVEAIYPKPNLSQALGGQTRYPYWLKGPLIDRANQAWSTDITYIRMAKGFVYLVAILEIFNTDQGTQFTSRDWISALEAEQIRISMDGRGRALDNVVVERLWRSVK